MPSMATAWNGTANAARAGRKKSSAVSASVTAQASEESSS